MNRSRDSLPTKTNKNLHWYIQYVHAERALPRDGQPIRTKDLHRYKQYVHAKRALTRKLVNTTTIAQDGTWPHPRSTLFQYPLHVAIFKLCPPFCILSKLLPRSTQSMLHREVLEICVPTFQWPSLSTIDPSSTMHWRTPSESMLQPFVHVRTCELARPSPLPPSPTYDPFLLVRCGESVFRGSGCSL